MNFFISSESIIAAYFHTPYCKAYAVGIRRFSLFYGLYTPIRHFSDSVLYNIDRIYSADDHAYAIILH